MISKSATTEQAIHELLANRWSGRAYSADRAVAREDLISCLEAARWAPSCFGDQPWRYLVFDRFADAAAWERACACLVEGNRKWAASAPVLMAAMADTAFHGKDDANPWGDYDTGAASMALALQATALGLMVHQMGGFDAKALASEFDIPARYRPMAMLTLGYQLAEADLPADARERELAARARRPLEEGFFEAAWEQPVTR